MHSPTRTRAAGAPPKAITSSLLPESSSPAQWELHPPKAATPAPPSNPAAPRSGSSPKSNPLMPQSSCRLPRARAAGAPPPKTTPPPSNPAACSPAQRELPRQKEPPPSIPAAPRSLSSRRPRISNSLCPLPHHSFISRAAPRSGMGTPKSSASSIPPQIQQPRVGA